MRYESIRWIFPQHIVEVVQLLLVGYENVRPQFVIAMDSSQFANKPVPRVLLVGR